MKNLRHFTIILGAGMAGTGLFAQSGTPREKKSAPAPAGVRVFVDPATGKIRQPNPEEVQRLLRQSRTAVAAARRAPVVVRHPNGAIGLLAGDRLMSYSVARKSAGGKVEFDCVKGDARKADPRKREEALDVE